MHPGVSFGLWVLAGLVVVFLVSAGFEQTNRIHGQERQIAFQQSVGRS